MTKNELLEDVQVGDIVKIYTESNEVFEGKIVDFGESGLKVLILSTNKSKRILYSRIMEYDIEDIGMDEIVVTQEIKMNDGNESFDKVNDRVEMADKTIQVTDKTIQAADENPQETDEIVRVVDEIIRVLDKNLQTADENIQTVDENIQTVDENLQATEETIQVIDEISQVVDEAIQEVDETPQVRDETSQVFETSNREEAEVYGIDRDRIFEKEEVCLNLDFIRTEWVEKLNPTQREEYTKNSNIIDYAKKIKEFNLNNDRVKRAIMGYKKMAPKAKLMNVFIALIYHELDDFKTAAGYYHEGGAFDSEFQLKLKFGYDDLFETAILAITYNKESEIVVKWLCEYAVNNNDYATFSYVKEHCTNLLNKVLLFWYADKPEIQMIPNRENVFAEENTIYLQNIDSTKNDEDNTYIQAILTNPANIPTTAEENVTTEENIIYRGKITYYNKEHKLGTIKDQNGGSIGFHIKQVKDYELQDILLTGMNYERYVTYIRGINYKNDIAADAIELDRTITDVVYQEPECEGYFDYYDVYTGVGKIHAGNKNYNFKFDAIIDPLLYADILSRPFSIQELSVRFYVKKQTGKKNKISGNAYNIRGVKEYTQEEINEFVSQKYVTRKEVNDWLGITSKKNSSIFRTIEYEPLREINLDAQREKELEISINSSELGGNKLANNRDGEKKAVSIILASKPQNPFAHLKRDGNGKKCFKDAHRYMVGWKDNNGNTVGVDLDKAEELFIESIKANDQINSSVANLVNIYIKRGGDYIVKGLQLLEIYGELFHPEKLTNLRIQLIDKSGNFEALEAILLSAIPNGSKKNTVWQYMTKLAGLYYKQKRWGDAIEWFERSITYLDKNKSEFAQYNALRKNTVRSLAVAKYTSGNRTDAISLAKEFILTSPEDLVMQSIANETFEVKTTENILDDIDNVGLQYEDDLLDVANNEMSLYLKDKIQSVDLSNTFSKVPSVYEKIRGDRYIGNAHDSNKAVQSILNKLLGKGSKKGVSASAEYRSNIYIGIARIISDSRENYNSPTEDRVALDEIKRYVSRYARYSADVLVEKYATVDSIRFLYIQALRNFANDDGGNIIAAINMLISTFFVDSNNLPNELHNVEIWKYKDSYYKMNCISTKDLLIASFMLQDVQEHVTKILQNIYNETKLRIETINSLNRIVSSGEDITSYYDYEKIWKKAKAIYNNNLERLGKEISDSMKEYHMAERINTRISHIRALLDKKLLWNQDELVIENYIKLITLISGTLEKYTVEEKIDGFRRAEMEIEELKREIEGSPTEFSYDYVYSKLDELRFSIRERFDELYQSSIPEFSISLSSDSVYVNEKTVEIAITFSNSSNKQDADDVKIEIEGSAGATFLHCEKKFTSVRSGEEQDYIAVFSLGDKVISEGQFEIKAFMQYTYKDSVESNNTKSINEILPINITDKANYIKIENKYNRIIRGSSVDIKTPELFKGRNELIDSICSSLSSLDGVMTKNRGIILWGQRRVGKNSVKDYLKEKIRSEYPDAYVIIELGSIGKCRNLREVLITIINKTEDALLQDYGDIYARLLDKGMIFDEYAIALETADNYMPTFSRFMDRLSGTLRKISEEEKAIPLYFIDEFSYLYEWIEKGELDGREFMRFWKSFIQDYGICAIIIAQDNIPVWKSRYENEFACMNHDNEITYLDFQGAKELICEPCQIGDRVLFTPEAVNLIYELTKGSAYLIVIFCKHVIDYLNDNYIEKATKTIVKIVLEKEFVEGKAMFTSDDFEPQIQDVANVGTEGDIINSLNEELLKEIASLTVTTPRVNKDTLHFFIDHKESAETILHRLKERKIIEVERGMYCSINMPLLQLYLLREQSLLDKEVLNKIIR